MSVTWFSPQKQLPVITLANYGMSFNTGCMNYLQDVKSIEIGLDTNQKQVIVKLNSTKNGGYLIPDLTKGRKHVRINCKEFIRYIETVHDIDLKQSKKYYADYDEDNHVLRFSINENIKNKQKGD